MAYYDDLLKAPATSGQPPIYPTFKKFTSGVGYGAGTGEVISAPKPVTPGPNRTANPYDNPYAFGPNRPVAPTIAPPQAPIIPTGPIVPPIIPPPQEPTVPGSAAWIVNDIQTPEEIAMQGILGQTNQITDPEQIYQDKLRAQQAEIDAQNAMYNDMLSQSRLQNASIYARRLGSGASLAVSQGLAGSNVGEGQIRDIETANMQEQAAAEALINEKRAQAIAGIKGQIRKSSEDEAIANKEARRKGAEATLENIKSRKTTRRDTARNAIKAYLAAGVDLEKMTDEERKKYLGEVGLDDTEIKTMMTEEVSAHKASTAKAAQEAEKTAAALTKTQAETTKILQDVANWGKMTDKDKATLAQQGIKNERDYQLAKGKTGEKNYDSKTIPTTIKEELFTDMTSNANAGGWGSDTEKKTLNDFILAYPEVDTDYITQLYEANK